MIASSLIMLLAEYVNPLLPNSEFINVSADEVEPHPCLHCGLFQASDLTPLHEELRGERLKRICFSAHNLVSLMRNNTGWKLVEHEMSKLGNERAAAIYSDTLGSTAQWTLPDVSSPHVSMSFMHSYEHFGVAEVVLTCHHDKAFIGTTTKHVDGHWADTVSLATEELIDVPKTNNYKGPKLRCTVQINNTSPAERTHVKLLEVCY